MRLQLFLSRALRLLNAKPDNYNNWPDDIPLDQVFSGPLQTFASRLRAARLGWRWVPQRMLGGEVERMCKWDLAVGLGQGWRWFPERAGRGDGVSVQVGCGRSCGICVK